MGMLLIGQGYIFTLKAPPVVGKCVKCCIRDTWQRVLWYNKVSKYTVARTPIQGQRSGNFSVPHLPSSNGVSLWCSWLSSSPPRIE